MTEAHDAPARGATRPLAVSGLCLLGALALVATAARVATRWSVFQSMPLGRQVGAVVAIAALAATLLAFWRMRRWGIWPVALVLLARLGIGAGGVLPLRAGDVALPVLVFAIGLVYWRRMR